MDIEARGATDPGREREHNEDFYLIDPAMGLFVVCDGMGGHEAGEVASQMAAERVRSYLQVFREDLVGFRDTPSARRMLERLVRHAIVDASRAVYECANEAPGRSGMGTTLSLVLVREGLAVMGHVGDSRVYLLRGGELHQLSQDHTYVAELVRGGLSIERARKSSLSHVLTRAVGRQPVVEVDTLVIELVAGDRLLLCSDGLVGHIDTPPELGPMLASGASAEALVAFGLERDGSDNVTALVLDARHEEASSPLAAAEQARDEKITLKVGAVGDIWLFSGLNLAQVAYVTSRMSELELDAGTVVIREGEDDDRLFVVLEGELTVEREGQPVAVLGPGDHFGEMALLSGRNRTATVVARSAVGLLVMEREELRSIIAEHPRIGTALLWSLAEGLMARLS